MNDIPYAEIREEADISIVRALIQSGWMCLEIYKKKAQVFSTDEFEEKPVYIMGNPQGG